jgi:[ribosomal protein S18]-alanine N-acetyltransferase
MSRLQLSTVAHPLPYHCRWMIRRDMESVLKIEQSQTAQPWGEETFVACLGQRDCIGMTIELPDDSIAGFMVYQLHKDHIFILNLKTHKDHPEAALTMMDKLNGDLDNNRDSLKMVVRETDLALCQFLRGQKFLCEEVLRGDFEDTGEDGYLFAFRVEQD